VELAPQNVLLRGELADALLQNRNIAEALAQFQAAL